MKTQKRKVIISDKVYIPISVYDELSPSTRKYLKDTFVKVIVNPHNCPRFSQSMPCKTLKEDGRGACYRCSQARKTIKCCAKTSKWFMFDRGDKELVKTVLREINEDVPIKVVDKTAFFKLKESMQLSMQWDKLKEPKKSEQKEAVKDWLEHKYGQLIAPPRFGKCVTGNTLIPTELGLIHIKTLFDKDKKEYSEEKTFGIQTALNKGSVTSIHKRQVEKTIKIKTSYGYEVEGTPEHPILVLTEDLRFKWKNLEDITTKDYICINKRKGLFSKTNYLINYNDNNTYIEKTYKNISIPKKMTGGLARYIGYITANGALSIQKGLISFTTNNKEIQKDYIYLTKKLFNIDLQFNKGRTVEGTKFFSQRVCNFLKYLGVKLVKSAKKDIPVSILSSKEEIIIEFLNAYVSCDGFFHKSYVQLCSASKKLIDTLHVILNNFGIVSKKTKRISWARNGSQIKQPYYYILVTGRENYNLRQLLSLNKKAINPIKMEIDPIDTLPIGRKYLRSIIDSKSPVTGWFNVNGNNIRLKIFDNPTKKTFIPKNLDKDKIHTNILKKINLKSFSKLNKKAAKRIKSVLDHDFFIDKVSITKEIKKSKSVYDFTVDKSHNFIANGIISHNTIVGAILACKSETRVAIIIHQKELLDQFFNTFYEFTDIAQQEKMIGRKLIKINPKIEEVDKLSVCLFTWQQFLGNHGKKRIKALRDKFGFILIDEAHYLGAPQYSKAISRFRARYRCGVTATPERKDQLHFRSNMVLGPPVVSGGSEQLACRYMKVLTDWPIPQYKRWSSYTWSAFWKKLVENDERNRLIAGIAKKDTDKGHKIIIPVKRVQHVHNLVKIIKKMCDKDIKVLAYFSGVKDREKVSARIRAGKYDVVVATKGMISVGFNAPPMSCIYLNVGGYHFDKNNAFQEYSRIRTVMKGKRTPLIRVFADEGTMAERSWNLLSSEFKRLKFDRLEGRKKDKRKFI